MGLFVEILLFAVIAAFLLHRLLGVLGKRTGEERQRPNPLEPQNGEMPPGWGGDKQRSADIIPLPTARSAGPVPAPDEPLPLAQGIALVQRADPSFEEHAFTGGAGAAYQMIVDAFAAGDKETLRPLLADAVYASFERAIDARGGPVPSPLLKILGVDLAEAHLEGYDAVVTVRFVSEQADDDGKPQEMTELWTFRRDTRSQNPNWALSATKAQAV
jgi:predicted lipid-binding transport protein (Tim44 family)